MDIQEFARIVEQKQQEVKEFLQSTPLKNIIGREAVDHFKKSFDDEGFTDETLNPWKEVERRKPDSPWYGRSGQTRKFSIERTSAKILNGETGLLKESIKFTYLPDGVRISNSMPYAAVHQYGLQTKIYGKKPFSMTARPFIGKSSVLKRKIEKKIQTEMTEIIKR